MMVCPGSRIQEYGEVSSHHDLLNIYVGGMPSYYNISSRHAEGVQLTHHGVYSNCALSPRVHDLDDLDNTKN